MLHMIVNYVFVAECVLCIDVVFNICFHVPEVKCCLVVRVLCYTVLFVCRPHRSSSGFSCECVKFVFFNVLYYTAIVVLNNTMYCIIHCAIQDIVLLRITARVIHFNAVSDIQNFQ